MSGKNTHTDKHENHEINPHREHALYEYYSADLLKHAEETKAQADKAEQTKADDKRH